MYKINIKSKDDYHTIINYLFEICDKFKVVNAYGDAKNIEKSKFADELNSFCIEEKKVKKWPGMAKSPKSKMRVYSCNKTTLKLFKRQENFFEYKLDDGIGYYNTFDIDEQFDISFYNNDECLLYTIGHEGLCISENRKLKEFLIEKSIDFEK